MMENVTAQGDSEVHALQSGTHAMQASKEKTKFELCMMCELVISFILPV